MKRQLSIQYEDMVNFINDKKKRLRLAQIITHFRFPLKQYADILYKLYADKNDKNEMLDYAIPIITDIYNDNYELKEPKYYWGLNLTGVFGLMLYAYKYQNSDTIGVSEDHQGNAEWQFTKTEFSNLLSSTNTNLTADNFTHVEEIEND